MLGHYWPCVALFRCVIPFILGMCIIFRPCLFSGVYLLFLLWAPFVPVPTKESMSGHTGIYIKLLLSSSVIITVVQLAFQIVLLSLPPYGNILLKCEFLELLLRQIGLVQWNRLSVHITANWIIPDAVMLPCSILFLIVFQKLVAESAGLHLVEAAVIQDQLKTKKKILTFFASIGRYGVLITLCVASVLMPCVQGALYFLVFLGAATWWACYKQLSKGFAIVQCILLPVVLLHIIAIYVYQFNFVRNFVNDDNPYTRYFGLMLLRTTLCAEDVDPREFVWYWREWPQWANPIVLYWLYTVLVLEAKALLNPEEEVQEEREVMQRADESTPLLGGVGSSRNARRFGSGKKSTIIQDSTGSVTVTGENMEDIPLDDFDEPHYEPTLFEKLAYALEATLQWIIKVSYLGTNIIMMAWSITYLSWLTFVLLLWANLIWAVPNQRRAMLFSSPFLVAYAWFLLLSAYVYSMDLTEAELPSKVQGINLAQIGFEKNLSYGYLPLIVKCLYTTMFWVTLRQYMQERVIKKQSSALADMVAPLQVTVGAATTGQPQPQPSKPGTMEKIGIHLRQFLTKFWIWIVAITLFAVAITGDRMTLFRVVYMALFLIFVLTFQLSFNVWRRIMFAFWIIVIIYSMIVLIMIYTYQFDNFQRYWRDYLHVSDEQQLDIGLEHFEIKELFVRLVTPTFFVIITVIQLHYFHNDFMKLSDPKNVTIINEDVEDPDKSSLQGGAAVESSEKDDDPTTTTSAEFHLSEVGRATSTRIQHNAESFLKYLHKTINHLFTFLELHMPKIVLLFAMFVCVYDENACYMLVVILIVLGCICGRMIQMITIYASSIIVSLMLLARMMFQVQYINSENWDTNCTYHRQNNKTIVELENDALWFGLRKTERNKSSLPDYVKYNILFILVVTVCSVIQVRQHYYKLSRNKPISRTFFMFPKITRSDADKDLKNMLKYLANYGFYKFGVEVSMMAMVFLIGVRMDIYSVFHSLWLLALFSTSRKTLSKIWVFYVLFTAISIPVQYFMAIGLPPTLCIDYPYDSSEVLRRLQEWAFLINQRFQLPTGKLFCDFLLLLVLSRQWVAFRIEKRYEGKRYAGGSNESIIHRYEEKGFENPIPDFVTYVRSYLDIAKRAVLMSFLWITLALVFLAGTNRVNIFSIGYLIGAFIFLWEGSDIYLRPIPKIIKRWNGLIAYCVITITLKAMLQLVGCVFIEYVPSSSCWLIQMWGVGCVRKFGNIALRAGFTDDEKCHVNKEFIGIAWDGLCFAFLIMQRRIFNSYNFFHMIDEIKATTILASRGAELIEEVRVKRIKEQELEEQTILEKIKLKMDKIKANQEKIEGPTDKQSHVIDSIFSGRPKFRRRQPKTYKQAVRSGDYYMFDELEDDDIDLVPERKEDEKDEEDDNPALSEVDGKKIAIREEAEPHPGTSKDEDGFSTDEESESEPQKYTLLQRIRRYLIFIWALIESIMTSMTHFFNRYSKDYRYLLNVLKKEKRILKDKTNYNVGLRMGKSQIWQPSGSFNTLMRQSEKTSSAQEMGSYEDEEEEMSQYDQPVVVRMLLAFWYVIISRSEILCYFMVFVYQMRSASFISLPLPLMVLFWGTLTLPRPTKTFWVSLIAYVEVIVLIKCIFQFEILPWNNNKNYIYHAYFPPKIIGVHKQEYYANWDLVLLLLIFFHRMMLKSMGVWSYTSTRVAGLLVDGEYRLEDGQLVPVSSSSHRSSRFDHSASERVESVSERTEKSTDRTDETAQTVKDAKERKSIASGRSEEEEPILSLRSVQINPCDHFPHNIKMAGEKYAEAFRIFVQQLLDPSSRVAADVYTFMFLCDFINFFVLLVGYSSFGNQQGDEGVESYLLEDKVPGPFLFMLIMQFLLIIVDRGIYLRKNILAKVIFQFVQIIVLHIWLFILYPILTEKEFVKVIPPQLYYLVKCFYFLLSAYQIRCGYPSRILGNFCCKDYTIINMYLFKGYMLIPFLFELRTVMDWMWTDTSMTIMDWLKMEDIYAHIYKLKCERMLEDQYPQVRGERKNPRIKYLVGGFLLAVIIGIIWFPLVFFSLQSAVGQPNVPTEAVLEVRIGPYEPIYRMTAQSNNIFQFDNSKFLSMQTAFNYLKKSEDFLANYEPVDVSAIKLSQESANIWIISPPDRQKMLQEVASEQPLYIWLQYKISHEQEFASDKGEVILMPNTTERINLHDMLSGKPSQPVVLPGILPKFLKIRTKGEVEAVSLLEKRKSNLYEDDKYRNISLFLFTSNDTGSVQEWWKIQEDCSDRNFINFLSILPYEDCPNSIIFYTFNEKIFPDTLSFLTGGGIVGLYTTIVLVASRVLRGFFAEQCFKIMFEDLPYVDRILQLCLNVYLVREAREFALEEDLFAKLVFLFRSPETLIKWSRPKEEGEGDDDGDGE